MTPFMTPYQTALVRQNLSSAYLAQHELESVSVIIIVITITIIIITIAIPIAIANIVIIYMTPYMYLYPWHNPFSPLVSLDTIPLCHQ